MATTLNPYITFRDKAREAMDFYQSVLGGELTRTTFGESHMDVEPSEVDNIMHSQLETPSGLTLMAADIPSSMDYNHGNNIAVSISGDDEAELRSWFEGLSAGGTVQADFAKAPWGDTFGMFTDKFGVDWMVNALGDQSVG